MYNSNIAAAFGQIGADAMSNLAISSDYGHGRQDVIIGPGYFSLALSRSLSHNKSLNGQKTIKIAYPDNADADDGIRQWNEPEVEPFEWVVWQLYVSVIVQRGCAETAL